MNCEKHLRYCYSHFPDILHKILSVLPKSVKIVNKSVVDLNFKDKKVSLTILIEFFG